MDSAAVSRAARVCLWIAALLVVGLALARLAQVSGEQLGAEFDILYETPNLRTIELIQQGRNVYDPGVYAAPPFWITLYTPLYHHVVALLPSDPGNPYFTGRLVGLVCMLLAAAGLLLAGRALPAAALLAFGAFFLVRPVTQNAALLKNDTLGLALSVAAVLVIERSDRGRPWMALSALACLLSLACKQSFVAAPVACSLWLALRDWRRGLRFAAATGVLIAVAISAARVAWGPGFFFSTVEALRNPVSWQQFREQWAPMMQQPVFLAILAVFASGFFALLWRDRLEVLRGSPYALYALASLAVLLGTVGKTGSNTNYFLEPVLACLLWMAASARAGAARPGGAVRLAVAAVVLAGAGVAEVRIAEAPEFALAGHEAKGRFHDALEDLAGRIRAQGTPRPVILNLVYAGLAHPLPGEIQVSDPFLYFLLWNAGKLGTDPVTDLLRQRQYDGVLVPPGLRPIPGPIPHEAMYRALFGGYRPVARFPAFDYCIRRDEEWKAGNGGR